MISEAMEANSKELGRKSRQEKESMMQFNAAKKSSEDHEMFSHEWLLW